MEIQHSPPAYRQIADYYQRLIRDGVIAEGSRLPAVRVIADEWGVVRTTAHRAVRALEAAQLVTTGKGGTYVRMRRAIPTPYDRVTRDRATLPSETVHVREAGTVHREYAAHILGLDGDTPVVRREEVTYRDGRPLALTVQWLPSSLMETAPELATTDQLDIPAAVEQATGRPLTRGEDAIVARACDDREAGALGIEPGTPILGIAWLWHDSNGVAVYGEQVLHAEHAVTYPYTIPRGRM